MFYFRLTEVGNRFISQHFDNPCFSKLNEFLKNPDKTKFNIEDYNFQPGELANLIELYYQNPFAFNEAYLATLYTFSFWKDTDLSGYWHERLDNIS